MKLREKRFKNLMSHIEHSKFYSPFLKKVNRLEIFPIIDKSIFMSNFDQINTVSVKLKDANQVALKAEKTRDFSPTINGVTIGLSSGTSGNRGVFLASDKERAYWVAAVLDRVIGFSLKKRSVAFFLRANSNIYNSVRSKVLSFDFYDLLEGIEAHINRLNSLQPTILVAQPSMLTELAQAMEKGELKINPSKIISVAEVLTPENKAYLSEVFKQTIHEVYQCTEGFLASTCKNGTLHFNEDFLIIEKKYLDEDKKRFHPIITDLKRRSQPVIRYELNDIVIAKNNCSCGSKMLGIEAIEGRSDDIMQFENSAGKSVKIFPDFMRRAIIMSDDRITDYALIQKELKQLMLYVDSKDVNLFNLASESIHQLLKKYDVNDVAIVQINSNQNIKGNKLRRIKYEIK